MSGMPLGVYEVRGPGGLEYVGEGVVGNQYIVNNEAGYNALPADGSRPYLAWRRISGDTNEINPYTGINFGAWQGDTNYFPPPDQGTNSLSWWFGSEWAGSVMTVEATNGQTLGTWGLPASIGPEGYELEATVIANVDLLNGAQVFLDGQSVQDLATASQLQSATNAYRPGYDVEFDGTYADGDWKIQRSDGTIALSGSVATLGDAINGRFTLTGTNTATLWTRVPGGDGMGGTWMPSSVVFGQDNQVYQYSFVNNPTPTPAPTPAIPSASPVPSPAAAPSPVTTNSTTTTALAATATNDIAVDVEAIEVPESDDGEEGVIADVVSIHEQLGAILEDFKEMSSNIGLTYQEFSKLALGGVGTRCTLQFGDVVINLEGLVPNFLRNGMKLIILLTVVFAAMRAVWETFSSA